MSEDEEADEIVRRLATPPPVIKYRHFNIPIIRKVIPGIIAQDILSVQPLNSNEDLYKNPKEKE